jgi:hypothetical protein
MLPSACARVSFVLNQRGISTMGEKKASEWPRPVMMPKVKHSCQTLVHAALSSNPATASTPPIWHARCEPKREIVSAASTAKPSITPMHKEPTSAVKAGPSSSARSSSP